VAEKVIVERACPAPGLPERRQADARAPVGDVVITPKLDRMFRSVLDALDVLDRLKDRDVSLHMIDLGLRPSRTGNGLPR
jgi:DNA invertase Pin-like site-specific DNA recombinase